MPSCAAPTLKYELLQIIQIIKNYALQGLDHEGVGILQTARAMCGSLICLR